MKLHDNQKQLIRHLVRFGQMDYSDCLALLDEGQEQSNRSLSYQFRPLTRHNYLSKHKNGVVTVLQKGRTLFPDETALVSIGGTSVQQQRANTVSKVAALLERNSVPAYTQLVDTQDPYFIPSACWRKIAPTVLSTTRFVGMLIHGEKRLAVYDIGDGHMEWQLKAERSLFFNYRSKRNAYATGILFICNDDCRTEVAQMIIRHTMWNRRQLIQYITSDDRTRPVAYSKAPIRLHRKYNHVYLTTPSQLAESIVFILFEDHYIKELQRDFPSMNDVTHGDFEDWPTRYFVNFTTDLLKYVYMFSKAKAYQNDDSKHGPRIKHILALPTEDVPITDMYPDIWDSEEATRSVYQFSKKSKTNGTQSS